MTEDERELDLDTLPPFPWRSDGQVIFDAEDTVVISETCAPTETVATTITDCMNSLAADGWLEPVSEFTETLYNDLDTTAQKLSQRNATLRAALAAVDGYKAQRREATGQRLNSPAEILDNLHDILTSGGMNAYDPCEFEVIPNVGPDGRCVAQSTTELDGKRYCRPHATALEEGVSP